MPSADHDLLFASARDGDAAALDQLMRVHRAQAVRYAMKLCISPADAEDAAQEALLAMSRYLSALRAAAALSSWIFTAVRTHCMRLARRSMRNVLVDEISDVVANVQTLEDSFVDEQLRVRLAEILGTLDERSREILLRRDVLGESAQEVAAALKISVDAVKSRLHRARAETREKLLKSIDAKNRNS